MYSIFWGNGWGVLGIRVVVNINILSQGFCGNFYSHVVKKDHVRSMNVDLFLDPVG